MTVDCRWIEMRAAAAEEVGMLLQRSVVTVAQVSTPTSTTSTARSSHGCPTTRQCPSLARLFLSRRGRNRPLYRRPRSPPRPLLRRRRRPVVVRRQPRTHLLIAAEAAAPTNAPRPTRRRAPVKLRLAVQPAAAAACNPSTSPGVRSASSSDDFADHRRQRRWLEEPTYIGNTLRVENGPHAFGNNSAESEPIWMKSGKV